MSVPAYSLSTFSEAFLIKSPLVEQLTNLVEVLPTILVGLIRVVMEVPMRTVVGGWTGSSADGALVIGSIFLKDMQKRLLVAPGSGRIFHSFYFTISY